MMDLTIVYVKLNKISSCSMTSKNIITFSKNYYNYKNIKII